MAIALGSDYTITIPRVKKQGGDDDRMLSFETREAIAQNLEDAGCCIDTIEVFMNYYDTGNVNAQLALLERQRNQLLSRVHKEERHICCLDYLVYQIKSRENKLAED